MKQAGGIKRFSALAEQRSTMLYQAIDTSGGYYAAPVDPACRSRVNAPFGIKGDHAALTKRFFAGSEAERLRHLPATGRSAVAAHPCTLHSHLKQLPNCASAGASRRPTPEEFIQRPSQAHLP